MPLPRHHQHAAAPLALDDRLAHESVEPADVAVDSTPAEVGDSPRAFRRLPHQLESGEGVKRREQHLEVDQTSRRTVRQLPAILLLDTKILDLFDVALRGCDQPLATAVQQDDRIVEVIEQRCRGLAAEVREEQVEAFLVHARLEQVAVALPLFAHVIAQRAGVEPGHRLQCTSDRRGREVELASGPDLCGLELGDRLLGSGIERADILDVIAEPLRAPGTRTVDPEHVDDAATDSEIPGDGNRALAAVAELHQASHEHVAGQARTALHLGQSGLDDSA